MDPLLGLAALPALAALTAISFKAGDRSARKKRAKAQMAKVDVLGSRKDAALLLALGFDPTRHRLQPVDRPGMGAAYRGLRVLDRAGAPLGFFSEKKLRSPKVRRRWLEEMRRTEVKA